MTLPLASVEAPAVMVAVVPPALTVRAEPAAKPEPEIVTDDPALPLVGLGAPTEARTVKLSGGADSAPTVTTTACAPAVLAGTANVGGLAVGMVPELSVMVVPDRAGEPL